MNKFWTAAAAMLASFILSSCALFPGWVGKFAAGLGSSGSSVGIWNVYAVGQMVTNASSVGYYNINGTNYVLSPAGCYPKAVKKSGDVLWIAGNNQNSIRACAWTNGVYFELLDHDSTALDMDVMSNKVVILGRDNMSNLLFLWKNGVVTYLWGLSGIPQAKLGLGRNDGKEYVAFTTNWMNFDSFYWVEGLYYKMGGSINCQVNNIYVDAAGNVGTVGRIDTNGFYYPCYWIGTAPNQLPGAANSMANDITKSPAGDWYVCGSILQMTTNRGCYWKNGSEPFILPLPQGHSVFDTMANCIAPYSNTVVVGGTVMISGGYNSACIWMPSGPFLPAGTNGGLSSVDDIFVENL